jgi:hypothetical protein
VARDSTDSTDSGEQGDGGDQGPASHEPRECMACRGSGKVISNLGGAPSELSCPWCAGGGVRQADVDAQARWLAQDGEGVAAAPEPTD